MNFIDMTRGDIERYNRIKVPESGLDWLLRYLTIASILVTITTLIILFM